MRFQKIYLEYFKMSALRVYKDIGTTCLKIENWNGAIFYNDVGATPLFLCFFHWYFYHHRCALSFAAFYLHNTFNCFQSLVYIF